MTGIITKLIIPMGGSFLSPSSTPVSHKKDAWIAHGLLGFTVLESVIAITTLLRDPSDADVARFLGYSAPRWVMVFAALILTVTIGTFYRLIQRRIKQSGNDFSLGFSRRLFALRVGGLVVFWICCRSILFVQNLGDITISRLYWQAFPLMVLLGVYALQGSAFLFLVFPPTNGQRLQAILPRAGALWAALAALGFIVYLSRFGLEKTWNGWYEYGIPLAHIQVVDLVCLAWLITAVLQFRNARVQVPSAVIDAGLCLVIWLAAVFTWLPMPIPYTYMSTMPFPPNQAVYPSSDAMQYDSFAEGLILREPWVHETAPNKPLYVIFLTLAHLVTGHDYVPVIVIQTLSLAVLPVLLYLLGKLSYNRTAGVMIAVLVILREYNQIFTGSLVTSSNSKLMLTELPTATGLCLLLLVLAWWINLPRQRSWLAVLAGGLAGLVTQIRLQVIVFLPILAALGIFYFWLQRRCLGAEVRWWKKGVTTAALIGLGFAVSIAPLLVRNYQATGLPVIEEQRYMDRTLTYSFASSGSQAVSPTGLIASGFVHNLIQPLLVLPSGFQAQDGWTNTLDLRSGFWITTDTLLTPIQAGWVLLNLALISIGIIAGWRRSGWVSLLPVLALGIYSLASATGGFSGQRFILPVDWTGYFYFLTGIAYLLGSGDSPTTNPSRSCPVVSPETAVTVRPARTQLIKPAVVIAILLAIGGLLPVLEGVFPAHRIAGNEDNRARLVELAGRSLTPTEMEQLLALLARPETRILQGSALYPREIYQAKAPGGFLATDPEVGAPFFTYITVGTGREIVLQPWDGTVFPFPHPTDVLLAGWQAGQHFHAFITIQTTSGDVIFSPNLQVPGE
jgi:hypothetical protein